MGQKTPLAGIHKDPLSVCDSESSSDKLFPLGVISGCEITMITYTIGTFGYSMVTSVPFM